MSWRAICLLKSEGGLGVKDIHSWNNACIIQNTWSLISQAGSLWIAWVNAYVLKGRIFQQVSPMQNSSWSCWKLLQLRTLAIRFLELRNGVEVWKYPGNRYCVAKLWEDIWPRQNRLLGIGYFGLIWQLLGMLSLPGWLYSIACQRWTDWLLGVWLFQRSVGCARMEGKLVITCSFGCSYSIAIWRAILQ